MAQRMDSSNRGQALSSRPISSAPSRGVGIASLSPKPVMAATVTPTSTPPIRVTSTRRGDGLSPSPLTTEDQKRYYDTSTWRMYDRIQASRPAKPLLPPSNSLSAMITVRDAMALPRYQHSLRPANRSRQEDDSAIEGSHPDDLMRPYGEPDEELIFDLEL